MTKRAVIFDLDGVLVDSEPQYLEFFRQFLLQNGCVPQEEGLRATVGSSNYETWRQLALMWSDPLIPPLELERIYLHQCGHLAIDYQASLFPGVLQLVQRLQRRGLVLAIASSSPMSAIRRMLEQTGFDAYISHVVSGDMFRRSKPDPEIYLHAISLTGFSPEQCLAVEDSSYGIQAAKRAGLEVVAVAEPFGLDQSQADYFLAHTCQLDQLPILADPSSASQSCAAGAKLSQSALN